MSLDRTHHGRGPGREAHECGPSSDTRRNCRKFCPAPESNGARSFESVGAMSGGRFDDYPAGAGKSGQPGVSHNYSTENQSTFSTCTAVWVEIFIQVGNTLHILQVDNTAARLIVRHNWTFSHHGIKYGDFCCFKGVTDLCRLYTVM